MTASAGSERMDRPRRAALARYRIMALVVGVGLLVLVLVGIPLQSEQDANVTFAQNQGAARLIAQKAAGTPAMTPPHPTCSPTPPHATARAASRRPSPPPTAPPRQPRQSSRSPPPRKRPSGNCASP